MQTYLPLVTACPLCNFYIRMNAEESGKHSLTRCDEGDGNGISIFVTFSATLGYVVTRAFWPVEEMGVPSETTAEPQVTGNFPTCPVRDSNPGSGERQLAVSGNA